jgi:hypothetical protein
MEIPPPPEATGVMDALTKVGFLFEQIEQAAGAVAMEVNAFKAEYGEWVKKVEALEE